MPIRLIIVCEHSLYLAAFRLLLEREAVISIVGSAPSATAALQLVASAQPHVLVVVGLEVDDATVLTVERLAAVGAVLFVGDCDGRDDVARLARAGARGVVPATATSGEAFAAIRRVADGATCLPPAAERGRARALSSLPVSAAHPLAALSPRERQVFMLLIDGVRTNDVGRRLGISPKTADTHRTHIMRKLGVHSVVHLVRFAARHRLLPELGFEEREARAI